MVGETLDGQGELLETTEMDYIQGGIGGSGDLFDDPIDDDDILTAVLPDADMASGSTRRYAPPPPISPPSSPDIGAKPKRSGKGKAAAKDKGKEKRKERKPRKRKDEDGGLGEQSDDNIASKPKRRRRDKNNYVDSGDMGLDNDIQPKKTRGKGNGQPKKPTSTANKRKAKQKLDFPDSGGEATESDRDWDEWRRDQEDGRGTKTKKTNNRGGGDGVGLSGLMARLRGSHSGNMSPTQPFDGVEQIDDSDEDQPRKSLKRTRL